MSLPQKSIVLWRMLHSAKKWQNPQKNLRVRRRQKKLLGCFLISASSMNHMNSVKVRFPPSPTWYCHVGTARMAVLNFLFAKKHGGTILFRSEDTDRERSTKEFEDDIVNQLEWLGLAWDEFYRSTEMVERHKEAMQQLIHEGTAYVSEEESKKDPGQKVRVVRLRNTGKTVSFTDAIRGDITVDTTDLGDFVIGRAIDDPLYHLAVVVDDAKDG